ncbi:MAG: hypothetical protein VX246_02495 [Myxococcota bacterium]|nr:hypothetical protein [Myxococcota bacterium]
MRIRLSLMSIVIWTLLAACNGPTFVTPGGALAGEVKPTPSDWYFASEFGTVQLETNPAEPYSVNIACVVMEGRLYAYAGESYTQWAENIETNANVRYRMDGDVYELRAERVADKEEIAAFGAAWTAKGRFLQDPTQFPEVWLFELVAR